MAASLAAEPVAFVFVALEVQRQGPWRAAVEEHALPGTQLYAEGQFRSPELKNWQISAAPRYAVVDAAGRIVSASAPSPGSEAFEALIREALAAGSGETRPPTSEPAVP